MSDFIIKLNEDNTTYEHTRNCNGTEQCINADINASSRMPTQYQEATTGYHKVQDRKTAL